MADSLRGLTEPLKTAVETLLQDLRASGIRFRVTSGRRTRAEQTRLYTRFLEGRTQLPVARPGSSMHELGLAVDLVFEDPDEWLAVANLAPSYGLLWRRSDPVHFELAPQFYSLVTDIPPFDEPTIGGSVLGFFADIFGGVSLPKCDPFTETC